MSGYQSVGQGEGSDAASVRKRLVRWAKDIDGVGSTKRIAQSQAEGTVPHTKDVMEFMVKEHRKLSTHGIRDLNGANEGLAMKMMMAKTEPDVDVPGQQKEEEARALIDASLNLLLNTGVIAALILSMLVPLVFAELKVHEDIEQLFGEHFVWVRHVHAFALAFTIAKIAYTLMVTSKAHSILSFWASDLVSKMFLINKGGICSICGFALNDNVPLLMIYVSLHAALVHGWKVSLWYGIPIGYSTIRYQMWANDKRAALQVYFHTKILQERNE